MIDFSCRLTRKAFALDAAFSSTGGCTALFGPSGSGKTTIAKLIAGLEQADRGRIVVNGRVLLDTAAKINVPVHKRRIGFVFQDGQLLPHLSVIQNLEYGRFFSEDPRRTISLDAVIDLLGIGHLLSARPSTLSGGERQRVAIGRALLAGPGLLIMDEPLASLDRQRKLDILPFIEHLRDQLALPIVYVSHAIEEVIRLASDVVLLSNGRVVDKGEPAKVLGAGPHASGRFDVLSFLTGVCVRADTEYALSVLRHPAGLIYLPGLIAEPGQRLRLAVQATSISLSIGKPSGLSIRTELTGRVERVEATSEPTALVVVTLEGGDQVLASLTRLAIAELGLGPGTDVHVLVKAVATDEGAVATFA